MKIADVSLATPEENLAYDEALLEAAEENACGEVLRFWTCERPFVVLGYSNKISENVHSSVCQKHGVPVLRRISGGGAVLQGRGCLNYSLILKIGLHKNLRGIHSTNKTVMEINRQAIGSIHGADVNIRGFTDLALADLKFSGNAQRRKKHALLFHGTFLLDFDIPQIEKFLALPPLQPEYRLRRTHADFLTNLKITPRDVKQSLAAAWGARGNLDLDLSEKTGFFVRERYSKQEWNLKF